MELQKKIEKAYDYLGWLGYQIATIDKVINKEKSEDKKKKYGNTLLGWLRHYDVQSKETIKDLEEYFKENRVVDIKLRKFYKSLTKV